MLSGGKSVLLEIDSGLLGRNTDGNQVLQSLCLEKAVLYV